LKYTDPGKSKTSPMPDLPFGLRGSRGSIWAVSHLLKLTTTRRDGKLLIEFDDVWALAVAEGGGD
jgi:hypothetical protein